LDIQNTNEEKKSVNPSTSISHSMSTSNLASMGKMNFTAEHVAQLASHSNVMAKFPNGTTYPINADRLSQDASGRLLVNVPEAKEEWLRRYTHVDEHVQPPVVPVDLNTELLQALIRSKIIPNPEQGNQSDLRRSMSFPTFQDRM
jgi:hypothetical protein